MQNNLCRAFLITKKINLTEDLSFKEFVQNTEVIFFNYN